MTYKYRYVGTTTSCQIARDPPDGPPPVSVCSCRIHDWKWLTHQTLDFVYTSAPWTSSSFGAFNFALKNDLLETRRRKNIACVLRFVHQIWHPHRTTCIFKDKLHIRMNYLRINRFNKNSSKPALILFLCGTYFTFKCHSFFIYYLSCFKLFRTIVLAIQLNNKSLALIITQQKWSDTMS